MPFFFSFLCTLSRTSIIFLELSFLCRNLLQSCGVCTVSHSIRSECFLSFGYIKLLALTQCLNSFQVLAIDGWVSCAPLLLMLAEWGAAVCHPFGRLSVPIRSLHLMLMGAACTPSHPKSQVPPWSTLLGSECLVIVPRVAFHCTEIQSTVLLLLQLCLEAAQVSPLVWQVKRGGSVWKTRRERFPLKHTHTKPTLYCMSAC